MALPYLEVTLPTSTIGPLTDAERVLVDAHITQDTWLGSGLEDAAVSYAIKHLVPAHYAEVKSHRVTIVQRTLQAVHERLTAAINYLDNRAEELRIKEEANGLPGVNSANARRRRDDLRERLQRRSEELEMERQLKRGVPHVAGGALIIPAGLLTSADEDSGLPDSHTADTRAVELLAMASVMEHERSLDCLPQDVSARKCGYDVESRRPNGTLRFVEVKGRVAGADTITVTRNEVLTALNKPDDYYLAIVYVENGVAGKPKYVSRPFTREPEFFMTTTDCKISELLARAGGLQ